MLTYLNHTKCADGLQCIEKKSVCDDKKDCNDKSDERCEDSCNRQGVKGKYIFRKCPEDSRECIPVQQFCDGIAQCPDAGDELQSNCTCEDWGLLSCKEKDHEVTKCLDTHWVPGETLNQRGFQCQAFLNGSYMYSSKEHVKEDKGMQI